MTYSIPVPVVKNVFLYTDGREKRAIREMDEDEIFRMLDQYEAMYGQSLRNYVQSAVVQVRSGRVHTTEDIRPSFKIIEPQKYSLPDSSRHAIIFEEGTFGAVIKIGARGMSLRPATTIAEVAFTYRG